jgi:hypothetical protein
VRTHERPPTTLTLVAVSSALLGLAALTLMLVGFMS